MATEIFKNGTLTTSDKRLQVFLYYSILSEEEYEKLQNLISCMPRIKGLKSSVNRAKFALDLMDRMNQNGLKLLKELPNEIR